MKIIRLPNNEDVELRDWCESDIMTCGTGMAAVERCVPHEAIAYGVEVNFCAAFQSSWWRNLLEWFVLRFAWLNRWWVRRQRRAFVQYTLTVEGGNGLLRSFAHNRDAVYMGAGVFTWHRRLEIPIHIEAGKKWTLECYAQGFDPGRVIVHLHGLVTRAEMDAVIRMSITGVHHRPVG